VIVASCLELCVGYFCLKLCVVFLLSLGFKVVCLLVLLYGLDLAFLLKLNVCLPQALE
jgi:hypothetical protein